MPGWECVSAVKSPKPNDLPRFADLEADYEILRELGRGGTAVVYLARERDLGREVALKVIRSTYVEDRDATARLMREARTVARLQHPNIVLLYGTRRLRDNSLALIMQYVPGRTLKSEIHACGPLPAERVEQILADLASALDHAHRHGIVHRDIKPENIYLDERTGTARLSDFGIARPLSAESSLTLPGTAIGTPAYMSPEQIDGATLDGRSDIYSLGLIGYVMLTGRQPWEGAGLYSIIYRQKHEMLPSAAHERPDVPQRVLHAVEGALRKDPDERWRDAAEFRAALRGRIGAKRSSSAAPPSSGARRTPVEMLSGSSLPEDDATIQFRPARTESVKQPLPAPDPARQQPVPAPAPAAKQPVPAPVPPGMDLPATPPAMESLPAAGPAAIAPVDVRDDESRGVFGKLRSALVIAAITVLVLVGALTQAALSLDEAAAPDDADGGVVTPAASEAAPPEAALPGEAAAAFAVSGSGQEGMAGDTLPQWLVLRVEDEDGRPVPGVPVQFSVLDGEGSVTPSSATTDELGLAGARLLALSPGVHRTQAAVEGRPDVAAIFSTTVLQRPPARVSAVSPTDVADDAASSVPLEVRVEDDRGSPVAGVSVQFTTRSQGGRTVPAEAVTDSSGVARAEWTIGNRGRQEAAATLADDPDATVRFRAPARSAPVRIRPGLAAGGTHTCALAGDGAAVCWGGNDNGQLGDGSLSRRATPVRAAAPEPLAFISAGVSHTCGISVSGDAFCWGANQAGQLGDGTRMSRSQPARVDATEPFTTTSVGMAHSCALNASGLAFCWGSNSSGQLGDGSHEGRVRPQPVRGGPAFRSIAAGWAHTCGLSGDGRAFCWGRNQNGELGIGMDGDRAQPTPVAGGHRFTMLAAGSAHTCGVRTDGAILCWGQNTYGQLGTGGTENSAVPAVVSAERPFSGVEAGGVHTCGLARGGAALCWGRNVYGQLGDGSREDRPLPTPVAGGQRFAVLFASGAHTCATNVDGSAYCWGFNIEGQLGDGTRSNQPRPVPVDWRTGAR